MANKWELEPNVDRAMGKIGLMLNGELVGDISDWRAELAIEIARKLNVHDDLLATVTTLCKQYEDAGLDTEYLRELISRAEGHR